MITEKEREEIRLFYKKLLLNTTPFSDEPALTMLCNKFESIRTESAEQARKDYQEVIDDYRRLTKELDIALNGTYAAKQASLCDIVSQIKTLGTIEQIINTSAEQALKEAWGRVSDAWLTTECWKDDLTLAVLRSAILNKPEATDANNHA